jgi:alpha-tubulin suppressor-like RCC1 family protein
MKKILLFILFYTFSLTSNAQCYETLSFGGAHTTAKKADGTLWGWGSSSWGNLSTNNTNESEPLPIQIGAANDWNVFKNGVSNTFAIKNNGTLWGCGSNQHGCLGVNSSSQNFTSFQQITTATNWIKVAPSYFFTIALKSDGTIWAWGQNDAYQLGNSPATPQQLSPIQVGTATDWVDIATGTNRTSFAIKADGTIWGWGSNSGYLLYFGSSVTSVSTPTQINTDNNWNKMSIGAAHILVQKTDGTLWSWGGGLGLGIGGTPTSTTTPQQVTSFIWKSFTTGTNTSFGIKSDGTLWAWGLNTNGQLGDGTSTDRLVPTQIGTDTNWDTVQARNFSTTMATKTDGTVWYWGTNYYGEFGNGTNYDTNYYNTPQLSPNVCVTTLSSPTFQKDTVFSLYPNPAKDLVTIAYDLAVEKARVEVYDISGRAINQYVLPSSKGELQIQTSTYQAGIYIVVVKENDTILVQQKLIIE